MRRSCRPARGCRRRGPRIFVLRQDEVAFVPKAVGAARGRRPVGAREVADDHVDQSIGTQCAGRRQAMLALEPLKLISLTISSASPLRSASRVDRGPSLRARRRRRRAAGRWPAGLGRFGSCRRRWLRLSWMPLPSLSVSSFRCLPSCEAKMLPRESKVIAISEPTSVVAHDPLDFEFLVDDEASPIPSMTTSLPQGGCRRAGRSCRRRPSRLSLNCGMRPVGELADARLPRFRRSRSLRTCSPTCFTITRAPARAVPAPCSPPGWRSRCGLASGHAGNVVHLQLTPVGLPWRLACR